MIGTSRLLKLILALVVACAATADIYAQKQGRETREFSAYGFSFRPLRDWTDIPMSPDNISSGIIGQFSAEDTVRVKAEGTDGLLVTPGLTVLLELPKQAVTENQSGGLRGRVSEEQSAERTVHERIIKVHGASLRRDEFKLLEPSESDPKIKKVEATRQEIKSLFIGGNYAYDTHFDVYTIQLADSKVVFVWNYPADPKRNKKWRLAARAAMKTFKYDPESVENFNSDAAPDSNSDYDKILEFHKQEVAQTSGWRLIETRSKDYIIKTNCEDKKSINAAIKRLEASRKLYEEDFPPTEEITNVSVVRICATADEFQMFSGMGGGAAGYFSPSTQELVLYFGENSNGLDFTLAVMSHEGFHQYGFFLFHNASPHQWFGEGHGDYYGAYKLVGSKLVGQKDMKGGLSRVPEIQKMIAEGTVKPLSEHIRYTHQEWQTQGPSGVSCYAQSFSLIYFLREGARGKVSSKYFKKAYKNIIPDYMTSLMEGYTKAIAERKAEAEEELKTLVESDAEEGMIANRKKIVAAPWKYLDQQVERTLRRDAIEASWGKIDEEEFEKNWLAFVVDEL
jgi:hypothetical protein